MTNLSTILDQLRVMLLSAYPSSNVSFEQIPEKNDKTIYPIFEINMLQKDLSSFAVGNPCPINLQIIFSNSTISDRYSIESFEERQIMDLGLRTVLSNWEKAGFFGVVTNISTTFSENIKGVYGSSNKMVNVVAIQFTILIKDA